MAKPLAGKRRFEALGRSAQSRGLPIIYERTKRHLWPMWARAAWARGWLYQQSSRQLTESIVQGFERDAAACGVSLQQHVTKFIEGVSNAD